MSPKCKKILYGFPQNSFNTDLVKELIKGINCALDFKRKPVGIKLLFTEEGYEGIGWEEPRVPLAYCVVVEKATRGTNKESQYGNRIL